MKLPSVKQLAQHTSQTFLRFPFALLSAALGASVMIMMIERSPSPSEGMLHNLLITAALGLPLFTMIPIVAEKLKLGRAWNLGGQVAGALALVVYYVTLPPDAFQSAEVHVIRFFLFNLALHLLVAIAPYLAQDEINGFWQYNRTLFIRFLTAALYSAVLFAGLSIALAAVDHLFEVNVNSKRYGQMWFFIAGIFNTWFFLAGVPRDFEALNEDTSYPKGLKVFTQYVLLPLVVIYLVILYAYEAKIIIEWNWPKGWVANLVLGFSVTGILALLLVHPVQQQEENKWIKTFGKWYYVALIPLVIMLLLAIWRRISDYGVTENRYFVAVLGACLTVIVIYFVFSKSKNIKIIPITLCLVSVLAAFGPWGAFAVSKHSQMNRLETLLVKNEILVDGKVKKSSQTVSFDDAKEISSMVNYLCRVHGSSVMQPWFAEDIGAMSDSNAARYFQEQAQRIVGLMGINYVNEWQARAGNNFYLHTAPGSSIPISGYDYLVRLQEISRESKTNQPRIDQEHFALDLNYVIAGTKIVFYHKEWAPDSIAVDLAPVVMDLIKEFGMTPMYDQIPAERMTVDFASEKMRGKIYFTNIAGTKVDAQVTLDNLAGDLLLATVGD